MGKWAVRARRRAQGKCYDCEAQAVKGKTRCEKHLEEYRKRNRKPVDAMKETSRMNLKKKDHIYDPNTPALLDRIQRIREALDAEREKTTHIVNACISSIQELNFKHIKRPVVKKGIYSQS